MALSNEGKDAALFILTNLLCGRTIGALQSRLRSAIGTLAESRVQYQAASGRITDADVAQTSSEMVRYQILLQTTSAVLSQANLMPQIALNLLTG